MELSSSLERMRHTRVLWLSSSSKKSDGLKSAAGSHSSSARLKEVPLSSPDAINQEMPSTPRRTRTRESVQPKFTLILIDTTGGMFGELSRLVAEFRKNLSYGCHRVVWLDCPGFGNIQLQGLNADQLPATDIIIPQPFHGSRLYQVLKLQPEFGGETPAEMSESYQRTSTSQASSIASPSFSGNLTLQNVEHIRRVQR